MTKLIGPELTVPDNWANLEEFAAWYRANGCPLRLPEDAKIFETDVSMSMIVFRQGDYQAEMYMMRPNVKVPRHSHPMRQLILWMGGWMQAFRQGVEPKPNEHYQTKYSGYISPTLEHNNWHAFETTEKGAFLFVLEQWQNHSVKSSATLAYDGEPLGPMHAETLRQLRIAEQ